MLEELLHFLGFGLCHQLPERSFFGGGVQLPVCARDTGIYVGFACALLVWRLIDGRRRSAEFPAPWSAALLVAFIVVMAVDGLTSYLGWRATTNELRLLTGITAGFGIAGLTVPLLNGQLWAVPGRTRVLGTLREALLFSAGVPVAYALTWWVGPLLGVAYPLATAFAIILTFVAVNAVIVALLPPFERRARRLRDAWAVFALALALTLLQLAGTAALKMWLLGIAGLA